MSHPPDWTAIKALFDAAMALPPHEREAHVRGRAVAPELRDEVLSLLAHSADDPADTGGFLRGPASVDDAAPAPEAGLPGQRLGAWQLERLLGTGGMGEVWLASRADGAYQGEAAVKLLKRGMDSAAVLQRFAQERQALARLDHAHIARLFDAGISPGGLPFFVMERVQGSPIDLACAGLSLEQRLALFLQLADAVAHAHRHLLVHRDLKPSNVLVNQDGQVKLLDFGVAKALDPLEGADPGVTQAGERPYTPHYASPEQVRGDPVTTATDIYSLGVLLYQLLTGQRPYGRTATTPQEAVRAVLEDEPTRPSALSPSRPEDTAWLATRKKLQGDLDNILLKALAKPLDRRYASVDQLAADVRAHLAGYPVSARAPSAGYLLTRFVRRHRATTAAAVLALVGVIGGAGVALWQAQVARAQQAVAEQRFAQVRQLANGLVFKYHDAIENLPGATKARETILKDAAEFLDSLAPAGSAIDPQLAYELASTWYRISRLQGIDQSINTGQHDQAQQSLAKALALAERYVNAPGMSTEALGVAINMHVSHGEVWQRSGRMAEADAALLQGLPILQRALQQDAKDTWALASAVSLHGVHARILGNNLAYASLGRWQDACAAAAQANDAAKATLAADPANQYGPDTLAFTLGEQAQCALLAGKPDEAEALFKQQIELRDLMAKRFADDMDFRYQRAISRANLARVLSAQGRHEQAIAQLDEALRLTREAAAADTGNEAAAPRLQALQAARLEMQVQAGDLSGARQQAALVLPGLPPGDASSFGAQRTRASGLLWAARAWRAEDARKALALAEEAAALLKPTRADDDNTSRRWLLAQALGEQAQARQAAGGDAAAALQAARQALQLWAQTPPTGGPPPSMQRWIDAAKTLAAAP
jgi:tetratricopeptide (TPR) repeat protein